MTSSDSPKPFLSVVAALVALVACLQAPDVRGVLWICLLYGVAALTILMVRTWLRGGPHAADPRLRLRCLTAGALVEAFLFVGAGYCTSIEPGVIKLFGVLPLGWSCAVLALIDELIRAQGSGFGGPPHPTLDRAQQDRWLVLAIGVVVAMGERLLGEEPAGLKGVLTALLVYNAYTCWRRYRVAMRLMRAEKE